MLSCSFNYLKILFIKEFFSSIDLIKKSEIINKVVIPIIIAKATYEYVYRRLKSSTYSTLSKF
jgi:hypothetical protein